MKKLGLCLSGGGSRGAYQIGALQALDDLGIYKNVQAFSGTSIGAANAAVISTNTIEKAKEIWFNIPENPLGDSKTLLQSFKEEKLRVFDNGLYSMDQFEKVLLNEINFNKLKEKEIYITISESGKESDNILKTIGNSLSHYLRKQNKAKYISLKELDTKSAINVIKASCSIPLAFSPVVIDGIKYYDGGVFDKVPINPLIEAGCTEIIVLNISVHNHLEKMLSNRDDVIIHNIKSSKSLGGALDFTIEHSKMLFDEGYKDTIEYFKDKE